MCIRDSVYKADGSEDEKYYAVSAIEVLAKRKKGQPRPELRDERDLEEHEFIPEGQKMPSEQSDSPNLLNNEAPMPGCCGNCASSSQYNAEVVMTSEEDAEETAEASSPERYAQKGRVKARPRRRGRRR